MVKKKKSLGDVTTLNVTYIHAGIEVGGKPVLNVVPGTAEACFDIRISPHTPPPRPPPLHLGSPCTCASSLTPPPFYLSAPHPSEAAH